jgi:hypothetical protein
MIQRIQTLFLLATAVLSGLLIFIPFQIIEVQDMRLELCLIPGCLSEYVRPFIYVPMTLDYVILLLSLAAIFGYKNRKRQMKVTIVIMVLSAILIGNIFLIHYVKIMIAHTVNYAIPSFFPMANVAFAYLAWYFIKKDEELVRNADRIR